MTNLVIFRTNCSQNVEKFMLNCDKFVHTLNMSSYFHPIQAIQAISSPKSSEIQKVPKSTNKYQTYQKVPKSTERTLK